LRGAKPVRVIGDHAFYKLRKWRITCE
jgi:hypothetical protein